jgi:hypothetical protein
MRMVSRLFLAVLLASLFASKKVFDSSLVDQVYWKRIGLEWDTIIDDLNRFQEAETNVTSHPLSSNLIIFENNATTIAHSRTIRHAHSQSNQENQTLCEATDEWANKYRLRNTNPGSEHVGAALTKNALSIADDLLGQTFCHEEGRFRTTSTEYWNTSNLELLKDWEFKLIYLAIHDFHHRPAREEYQERVHCPQTMPTNDFQCSGSKFLVTSIPNLGMGAAVRLSAVSHVLSAIATDRVPLFVANTTAGPQFLQDPWYLASCDRKDLQCVFLPTTPCTLLASDLEHATVVTGNVETMKFRVNGKVPTYLDRNRVIVLQPSSNSNSAKGDKFPGIHKAVRRRMHDRVVKLLAEWNATSGADIDESKLHFLQEAARRIARSDDAPDEPHYGYGHRSYRIPHAILLYLLRPNKSARTILDEHMRDIFQHPVTPETTIGLPIRGSDKCHGESTCLEFDQYMRLAKETWEGSPPSSGTRGTLIMTTEDEQIFRQRLQYNETTGFPLDFIVNEKDSLQGSGNVGVFGENADDIMMSSLVAIRMQLNSGQIYGNCCSNFHLMLFDFVHEGCGLTTKATCLQETEDYNVCCAWTRTEECDDIRREHQTARRTSTRDEAPRQALDILSGARNTSIAPY